MSNDPYQPPGSSGLKPQSPRGLTAVSVICLIIGILGLIGSCIGFAMPAIAPMMIDFMKEMPAEQMPEAQKQESIRALELSQESAGIQIAMAAVNLFVAGMLLLGAIFCLTQRGHGLLKLATLVALIFVILRIGIGIVMVQLPMMEKMKAENLPTSPMSLAIGVGVALLFAAFYAFAHIFLRKPAVSDYFDSLSNLGHR